MICVGKGFVCACMCAGVYLRLFGSACVCVYVGDHKPKIIKNCPFKNYANEIRG